jgi:hypothetical protein
MKQIWFVLLFMATTCAAFASAREEAFTRLILSKLEAAIPGHKFEFVGSLELRDPTSGRSIYLDRIFGYTTANPKLADTAIADYVSRVAQFTLEAEKPVSPALLRLAVRNSTSLQRAIESLGAGAAAAYPQELVGDLVVVPVIDAPSSVKYVGEKDLSVLGLSEAEARKIGGENLRKIQRPLEEVAKPSPKSGIGVINEEYAASRLIFISDWAALGQKIGGNLIVMAPAFNLVIYSDGSSPIAVDALRTLGLQLGKSSQVPLSPHVFRFKQDHWELVK